MVFLCRPCCDTLLLLVGSSSSASLFLFNVIFAFLCCSYAVHETPLLFSSTLGIFCPENDSAKMNTIARNKQSMLNCVRKCCNNTYFVVFFPFFTPLTIIPSMSVPALGTCAATTFTSVVGCRSGSGTFTFSNISFSTSSIPYISLGFD